MNYETLIEEFVKTFPELNRESKKELSRTLYQKEDDQDDLSGLQHVFFGRILCKFLIKGVGSIQNIPLLERAFGFLEAMATSEDENVRGVLYATILEDLGDDKSILEKARSMMGPQTLKLSHQAEKNLGRE